jgi:hypothetical protein
MLPPAFLSNKLTKTKQNAMKAIGQKRFKK